MKKIRTYRELSRLNSFDERFLYLKLNGIVGESTFGYDRYLNQILYKTKRWREARDVVIIRDRGCDLGVDGYDIHSRILIHHMNPISIEDVEEERDCVFDPELLITTTLNTHNAIHYGNEELIYKSLIERKKNDTCPWR